MFAPATVAATYASIVAKITARIVDETTSIPQVNSVLAVYNIAKIEDVAGLDQTGLNTIDAHLEQVWATPSTQG